MEGGDQSRFDSPHGNDTEPKRADDDLSAPVKDENEENWVPKIGMEFESEEHAYTFYNSYGEMIGFSIRRHWRNVFKDGTLRDRMFTCSAQGFRCVDKRDENVKRHRSETRTGCLAHMFISLQLDGKYRVCRFEASHNHEVVSPLEVHLLRSHRSITRAQADEAYMADSSGIAPKATMELMARQAGGRENLGFFLADYKNYLRSKRKTEMKNRDAGAVLEFFQKMQLENPSSFYAIQLDMDDLITNVFWTDTRMMVDYSHFVDVVCFDTTYKTNKEGRPFALFVGVNHHKQTIVFGVALLYDETIETFKWLIETLIKAMSGRMPKTILTDQDAAMANAIASSMPETCHRLCVWHMYQNAAKHMSSVFQNKSFVKDFNRCVYDYEEEEEFIMAWNSMLQKYNLEENMWLKEKFEQREKWALVYGRNTFCADMSTTQRSESMNRLVKRYLNSQKNLLRFFEHFERLVEERRYEELRADFKMNQSTPVLAAPLQILKHAASVYTPVVFGIFQQELLRTWDYDIHKNGDNGIVIEYKVSAFGKNREHTITFDSSNGILACSCKRMEFVGILCRHALKVLDSRSIRVIPSQYILKRWTKDAKVGIVKDHWGSNINLNPKEEFGRCYKELCPILVRIATRAAESKKTRSIVLGYSEKILREVEESLKHMTLDESITLANVSLGHDGVHEESPFDDGLNKEKFGNRRSSIQAKGIKIKENAGRGSRRRYKGVLEKVSKKKRAQTKNSPLPNAAPSMPCSSFEYHPNSLPLNINFSQVSYGSGWNYSTDCQMVQSMYPPYVPTQTMQQPLDIISHGINSFSQLLKQTLANSSSKESTVGLRDHLAFSSCFLQEHQEEVGQNEGGQEEEEQEE